MLWTTFGKVFGPYQYAKLSLIHSGRKKLHLKNVFKNIFFLFFFFYLKVMIFDFKKIKIILSVIDIIKFIIFKI